MSRQVDGTRQVDATRQHDASPLDDSCRHAERYRRVLRLLPAVYRRAWADDMVGAYLDSVRTGDREADELAADHGRPSAAEVGSVVALAVRLRLGGVGSAARPFAWGQAVRVAVLMIVLAHAVLAAGGLGIMLWATGKVGWLPAPPPGWSALPEAGLWRTAAEFVGLAWPVAYVALVLGHRRVAQAVALLAVASAIAATAAGQATGDVPMSGYWWALILFDLGVVVAMAAFQHGAAAAVPGRPWLLALPAGVLLLPLPLFALQTIAPTAAAALALDRPGILCLLAVAASLTYLAGPLARRPGPPSGSLALALTLLAATAVGLRLATLPGYLAVVPGSRSVLVGVAQLLAVAAVAVPLAVLAGRALRRLPPTTAGFQTADLDAAAVDAVGPDPADPEATGQHGVN